jgi:hypothetical protein
MTFLEFFKSVFKLFGDAGSVLIGVVVFLVGFGIYKFVKDWLPW